MKPFHCVGAVGALAGAPFGIQPEFPNCILSQPLQPDKTPLDYAYALPDGVPCLA